MQLDTGRPHPGSESSAASSTDIEWEKWAQRDPYFGVLTDPMFRSERLTDEGKTRFFESGVGQVNYVLHMCRSTIDPGFQPQRILDFGCGVGRLVIPFARMAREVVGVDVAPSMLAESRLNCDRNGLTNVSLVLSDDTLSGADGQFDLVHTCIVLQHIEVARGREIFARLVDKVRPGGCGAIHVTFGWDVHAETFGFPPPLPAAVPSKWAHAKAALKKFLASLGIARRPVVKVDEAPADPEMQMNYYNMSELMFIMQRAGVRRFHAEFADHGGALGVFLFFQKPQVP
jgi:SAM-dependent methyltransferase